MNNPIGTILGSDITGVNPQDTGVNGTGYVNISSSTPFSSVIARSTSNSFEFDDVAYTQVVPEPASGLLLSAGLVGLGFMRRRKSS